MPTQAINGATVDIAIPTYDGRGLLDACLASVMGQDPAPARVVVVDDGSRDGTPEFLREHWPAVEVVVQPENRGVAAALNTARHATSAHYLALVNNDVELAPGWLGRLTEVLDAHPEAASASGKLLSHHHRELIDAAGDEIRHSGIGRGRGQGQLDQGQYDEPDEVFGACAGAAVYRRAALEDVGPFEETFVAYREDVDWGLRARLRGWTARYDPRAVAWHVGSATTGGEETPRYARLSRRNSLALVVRAYPAALLLWRLPNVVSFHLAWLGLALRHKTFRAHLAGIGDFVRAIPALRAQRAEIQARRRIGARELDRAMGVDRR